MLARASTTSIVEAGSDASNCRLWVRFWFCRRISNRSARRIDMRNRRNNFVEFDFEIDVDVDRHGNGSEKRLDRGGEDLEDVEVEARRRQGELGGAGGGG
eukprot:265988-Prorocentrum_minimum.AAC.1